MKASGNFNMAKSSLLTGFFLACFLTSGWASIIHVPADFSTIQEAIDSSSDGDEILLADMTFHGSGNYNIDFRGRAVTVRSASGNAPACVIDIQGDFNGISQRGFVLYNGEDTTSAIRDLTIINGVADGP